MIKNAIKLQITPEEAIGATLTGTLRADGLVVLVFDRGFVVLEARAREDVGAFDSSATIGESPDFDWLLFSPEEMAEAGFGELEALRELREKTLTQQKQNVLTTKLNSIESDIWHLRETHGNECLDRIRELLGAKS